MGFEFYHELGKIENGVPRSYPIKQCRNNLNKLCYVTSTSGKFEGAQIPFKSLLSQQISASEQENPAFDFDNETFEIKISGDGAKMTEKTNYILLFYAPLQKKDEVMAAKGTHTIAVVNGIEKYEIIQVALKDVFAKSILSLSKGAINIDGQKVKLEFFLRRDNQVLLTGVGLKGATPL